MERKDLKTLKKLDTINFDAKNIYHRYYLRYNGEAAASLEDIKDPDSLNYIVHDEGMVDVFEMFGLDLTDVLYIDSYAVAKALSKRTKIEEILVLDGKIIIVSNDKELAKIADDYGWLSMNGLTNVPIALITDERKSKKIFDIARVELPVTEMHDVTDLIEPILAKFRVTISADGENLYVGKPLFPTLNNKCELFARFFPMEEGKFIAHICVKKEHVSNYHTFIAFSI